MVISQVVSRSALLVVSDLAVTGIMDCDNDFGDQVFFVDQIGFPGSKKD
jgi:hypothetical protein